MLFERPCCGCVLLTILLLANTNLITATFGQEFLPNRPDAVPSFLIIGTAKGGTTDLFEQLTAVTVNEAASRPDPPLPRSPVKEAGLLSRGGIDATKMLPQRLQYVEYLRLLRHPCGNATAGTFQDCIAANAAKQLTLDATPTYFFSAVAPLYLRELSPLSKVIMMVREPVERAEVLYRHYVLAEGMWPNTTIDQLATEFFTAVASQVGAAPALQRAAACNASDVLCLASSWRDISGLTLMDPLEHKLFAGGLYRYALAAWRYHYFQRGRVLIIDSHAYFERRLEVMEKVIRFLYGRPMLQEERILAASGVVFRKAVVSSLPRMSLSPPVRRQLTDFYQYHVMGDFFRTLNDLQAEGAWVVGFDTEPWRKCPGFDEFRSRQESS